MNNTFNTGAGFAAGAQASGSKTSNRLLVPGAERALSQMKYEIANEFGVNLGADTTSRQNGSVGGEITKRLVALAQSQLGGTQTTR
jgi:hypothetical protein